MKEIPASATAYKKTPEFTEETVPVGLLKAHQTKEGTWGKINVTEGRLRYRILEPEFEELVLSPDGGPPGGRPPCGAGPPPGSVSSADPTPHDHR